MKKSFACLAAMTVLLSFSFFLWGSGLATGYICYGPYEDEYTIYGVRNSDGELVNELNVFFTRDICPYISEARITYIRVTITHHLDEQYTHTMLHEVVILTGDSSSLTYVVHWVVVGSIRWAEAGETKTYTAYPNLYLPYTSGTPGEAFLNEIGAPIADGDQVGVSLHTRYTTEGAMSYQSVTYQYYRDGLFGTINDGWTVFDLLAQATWETLYPPS